MPNFDIIKENKADKKSFRVSSIIGIFDLQNEHIKEHFSGSIDIENKDWNIGIIYGNSGTGKSTIAKQLFGNYFNNFNYNENSIIDDMPKNKTLKEIIKMFNSVGFSSPMSWLKPYNVLSNGEKMRVDLANCLLQEKDIIIFDEYSSVINREVAKIGSYAIQKSVRNKNKKFIAVSCHDDIIDWLEPDWVFCTNNMKFEFVKKKDPISKLIYMNVTEQYGKHLENIII